MIQAIRGYGEPAAPEPPPPPPNAWSLAWQLEKMQADQEAQFLLVDQGQDWLQDILKPEPWDERVSYGPVSGVAETVDPELAKLRYRLWRRVMAPRRRTVGAPPPGPRLPGPVPDLERLAGVDRARKVQLTLPGCRNRAEWQAVAGERPAALAG